MKIPFATGLTDDVLSPMLIKELRQGLKSKAFYFAFLLMQGLMVFCVLMYASAVEANHGASGFDSMFWFCIGGVLVVLTPLRALGALQQEIKGNTLELIFLTRLGAWRIVAGKWLALYSQALLLAAGTLPYLLLRYFLGGINVADDLLVLFWLLLSSATLTAIGVCFSSFPLWLRVVIVAAAVILPFFVSGLMMARSFGGSPPASGAMTPTPLELISAAAQAVLVTALFLTWAASRIAPPASNYSLWKRLIALVLVVLIASGASSPDFWAALIGSLIILVPVCVDALCEQPRFIPSVYAPFARRGVAGRIAGLFLYPGWPAGILFTLLICGIFIAFPYQTGVTLNDEKRAAIWALPGALLFPLAVVIAIRARPANLLAAYLGVMGICLVVTAVTAAIWGILDQRFTIDPLAFIPTCAFVLHISTAVKGHGELVTVTACISALSLAILLIRARPVAAQIAAIERASANGTNPDASAPK